MAISKFSLISIIFSAIVFIPQLSADDCHDFNILPKNVECSLLDFVTVNAGPLTTQDAFCKILSNRLCKKPFILSKGKGVCTHTPQYYSTVMGLGRRIRMEMCHRRIFHPAYMATKSIWPQSVFTRL